MLDYRTLLLRWEDVFGRSNINVRIYDRSSMTDGKLLADFAAQLGIPSLEGLTIPKEINRSLANAVLRDLKLTGERKGLDAAIASANEIRSAWLAGDETITGSYSIFDDASRRRFQSRFVDTNAWVARRYCGRGSLFKTVL